MMLQVLKIYMRSCLLVSIRFEGGTPICVATRLGGESCRVFFYFLGCLRWSANTFTQTVSNYGWAQRKNDAREEKKRERRKKAFNDNVYSILFITVHLFSYVKEESIWAHNKV